VDYSRSIIMTSATYIDRLRQVATKKEAAAQLKEAKKLEGATKKRKQQEDKLQKETQKKRKDEERAEKRDLTLTRRRLLVMAGEISFKLS
jgi:type IV secretory pathway VirB10-like protein